MMTDAARESINEIYSIITPTTEDAACSMLPSIYPNLL